MSYKVTKHADLPDLTGTDHHTQYMPLDDSRHFTGDVTPPGDGTGKLGTGAARWSEVHGVAVTTGDLDLRDDSRNAHWRFVEYADHIKVMNIKTGKSYRLVLDED